MIVTLSKLVLAVIKSVISFCTFLDITAKSKSPILSVELNDLSPSGPKNTTSPATSLIVSESTQPILVVIGCNTKSASVLPTNLSILFSLNIINCSLKAISPVISVPTLIFPAPLAGLKSLSV